MFFFFSTYFLTALHLYLKIKIAATSIVKTATRMFISSTRHSVADRKSLSGTWNIVPFSARQNQTIRFAGLDNVCRNLYRLQKSISIACNVPDNFNTGYHLYGLLEFHLEERIFTCHLDQIRWSMEGSEKIKHYILYVKKQVTYVYVFAFL